MKKILKKAYIRMLRSRVDRAKEEAVFYQLNILSDKELDDIGVNRGDIRNIARSARKGLTYARY
jgi:uncharacterized protein YjiS (DUF1127 family)